MAVRSRLKEESLGKSSFFLGASSSPSMEPPRPKEGLHETAPPPFLTKTYELVDDISTDPIVSWSKGNDSFVIWDPQNFAVCLLPKYFKHNNFSSFIRQLNTYGFRKVDPERWEFANEGFLRGRKSLLKNIRRKTTIQAHAISQQALDPCVEVGLFGLDGEVDQLKRDKQVLMVELVKLRQQQQSTKAYLQAMEDRLRITEMKQQQMKNFLARAMQNPNFFHHLAQQNDLRRELEQKITKKRRQKIEQVLINHGFTEVESCVKIDPFVYSRNTEFQAAERGNPYNTEKEDTEGREKEIGEGFWENLLNGSAEEAQGFGVLMVDGEGEDDVNILSEHFGYLGSCPQARILD